LRVTHVILHNHLLVSQGRSPLHHNTIVLALRNRPPIFYLENLLLKSGRWVSPGQSAEKSLVAFHCSAIRTAIAPKPRVGRVNMDLMLLSSRPKRWLGAIYSPPQEMLRQDHFCSFKHRAYVEPCKNLISLAASSISEIQYCKHYLKKVLYKLLFCYF
jgi:hypothetical protein